MCVLTCRRNTRVMSFRHFNFNTRRFHSNCCSTHAHRPYSDTTSSTRRGLSVTKISPRQFFRFSRVFGDKIAGRFDVAALVRFPYYLLPLPSIRTRCGDIPKSGSRLNQVSRKTASHTRVARFRTLL